jgi:hypothetical protein
MTGDKFRARANEYIKAAHAVTDPVHELALMNVAQRWLRLRLITRGPAASRAGQEHWHSAESAESDLKVCLRLRRVA